MFKKTLVSIIFMTIAGTCISVEREPNNIYMHKDSKGRIVLSDIPADGSTLVSKGDSQSTTPVPAPKKEYVPKEIDRDKLLKDALISEKRAYVDDKARTYRAECLDIEQKITHLKDSRNYDVDPADGGNLNIRKIRELEEKKRSIC